MPRVSSTNQTAASGLDDGEEWIAVPDNATEDSQLQPSSKTYVDFQIRTFLGNFSFHLRQRVVDGNTMDHVHRQEQSNLFRLPVEIRLYLYTFVFRCPTTGSGAVKLIRRSMDDRRPTVLNLLLACRQVHIEAEDMFYSINRLSTNNPYFSASLTPRRRAAVHAFTIPAASASALLGGLRQLRRHFLNLKSLHIERKTKLEYLSISSWAVMAPQLVSEIEGMTSLEDIRVLSPEVSGHDATRQRKMEEIDKRLCDAVRHPIPRVAPGT